MAPGGRIDYNRRYPAPSKEFAIIRIRQANRAEPRTRRSTRHHRDPGDGNTIVLATVGAVVLATLFAVNWITPVIHAAAAAPFFFRAMRRRAHSWALVLAARWAVALFSSILVLGVFLPDRMIRSLPMAATTVETVQLWVSGGGAPPANYGFLLWGLALFLGATVTTGGIGGFVVGSIAIGGTASGALYIERHGYNLIQTAFVAVPIWQWMTLLAGIALLVPASLPFYRRVFPDLDGGIENRTLLKRYMYAGAGLFALSLVLRLTTEGLWRSLIDRWTVI
ncbi:MAG: hypothetical protein O7D32_08860 [bacterium]|nr:hypothetical protein [bacterium]